MFINYKELYCIPPGVMEGLITVDATVLHSPFIPEMAQQQGPTIVILDHNSHFWINLVDKAIENNIDFFLFSSAYFAHSSITRYGSL